MIISIYIWSTTVQLSAVQKVEYDDMFFPCSPRCKSILRLLNYHVSWSKPTANGSGLYDSCVSQTVGGQLAPPAPISCLQWSPWNFVPGCNFDLAHGGTKCRTSWRGRMKVLKYPLLGHPWLASLSQKVLGKMHCFSDLRKVQGCQSSIPMFHAVPNS